jgi:hypothetical protein
MPTRTSIEETLLGSLINRERELLEEFSGVLFQLVWPYLPIAYRRVQGPIFDTSDTLSEPLEPFRVPTEEIYAHSRKIMDDLAKLYDEMTEYAPRYAKLRKFAAAGHGNIAALLAPF